MSTSTYVCRRCGLAAYPFGPRADVWKHAAGSNARSCGRPPQVVGRAQHEAELREFAAAARAAVERPR